MAHAYRTDLTYVKSFSFTFRLWAAWSPGL
jgi:hypothetical protein